MLMDAIDDEFRSEDVATARRKDRRGQDFGEYRLHLHDGEPDRFARSDARSTPIPVGLKTLRPCEIATAVRKVLDGGPAQVADASAKRTALRSLPRETDRRIHRSERHPELAAEAERTSSFHRPDRCSVKLTDVYLSNGEFSVPLLFSDPTTAHTGIFRQSDRDELVSLRREQRRCRRLSRRVSPPDCATRSGGRRAVVQPALRGSGAERCAWCCLARVFFNSFVMAKTEIRATDVDAEIHSPAWRSAERRNEAACCLTWLDCNPKREGRDKANFFIFIARNPLKRLNSEK